MMRFLRDLFATLLRGNAAYWSWIVLLVLVAAFGGWHYLAQLRHGLVVTNLSDQVSWGLYIGNFTFFGGIAAASIMMVIPIYVFDRDDSTDMTLLASIMAIAAIVMAMLYVLIDIGRPDRAWHMLPFIGRFNFPLSMLAWDVVVLGVYIVLTLWIFLYTLFSHYRGRQPQRRRYFALVLFTVLWAISIHTVEAFLYGGNSSRPLWNNSMMAPRFIASAFAATPALAILTLQVMAKCCICFVRQGVIHTLGRTMTLGLQVTLFFIGVELFTDFYNDSTHAASIRYLFLGLGGYEALIPWIWTALVMLILAVTILMIGPLRRHQWLLNLACLFTVAGVWLEKGVGMVIPGFIPTPLGEVFEYSPSLTEVSISAGVLAIGLLAFTLLAKAAGRDP